MDKTTKEIKTEELKKVPEKSGKKTSSASAFMNKYGIIIILLLMIIGISILEPKFLSYNNIMNLLTQSSMYGILALGLLLVIVSKGIDLSVGSILAFSAVVTASISQLPNATSKIIAGAPMVHIGISMIVAILIGAACGFLNGTLISRTGIPAFIATLGMYTAARGAALMYTAGKPVSNLNPAFNFFGSRLGGQVPVPVLIYLIVIAFTYVLLKYTSFGASVYAIGGNVHAAEISGIKVKRNISLIYMYSGILAGICALISIGRTGSTQPTVGTGWELIAIAATTIGGTSHSGGIGTVWGTVVGTMILAVITNGFTLLSVNAYLQNIIQGVIIVGAVIFDMRKNSKKA